MIYLWHVFHNNGVQPVHLRIRFGSTVANSSLAGIALIFQDANETHDDALRPSSTLFPRMGTWFRFRSFRVVSVSDIRKLLCPMLISAAGGQRVSICERVPCYIIGYAGREAI